MNIIVNDLNSSMSYVLKSGLQVIILVTVVTLFVVYVTNF